jgi:hypothetical protein
LAISRHAGQRTAGYHASKVSLKTVHGFEVMKDRLSMLGIFRVLPDKAWS